jgi:hypothetical protein
MIRKQCSENVRYVLALTAGEAADLIAELPDAIGARLEAMLDLDEIDLRYDKNGQRAYYVTRQGHGLALWIWENIKSFDVAERLLPSIAVLKGPMTEDAAIRLYETALYRGKTATLSTRQPSPSFTYSTSP